MRGKVGAPQKSFEDKGRTGQFLEAKAVLNEASSGKAVLKAAALAADSLAKENPNMKDASYVYNQLCKDPVIKGPEIRCKMSKPIKPGMVHLCPK